jgi:hypothetical protein
MATIELINTALSILKGHDFYYFMDDNAYTNGSVEQAKQSMRDFVAVTNEIGGEMRDTLRALWTANYHYSHCFLPGWTSPDAKEYKSTIKELNAKVNTYLAA